MSQKTDINVIEKKTFTKELNEKSHTNILFLKSLLAQRMANDIIYNKYYLSLDKFLYSPETVKSDLHWEDISNDNIQLFLDSISQQDNKEKNTYDSLCPFDNYILYKLGLKISVMVGQTKSVVISPIDSIISLK